MSIHENKLALAYGIFQIAGAPPVIIMPAVLIAFAAIIISVVVWGIVTRRWSAKSREALKQQADAAQVHPLMRVPVPWVFILAYVAGFLLKFVFPIPIASPRTIWMTRLVGYFIVGFGVILAFSALGIFKNKDTATIPFETPSTLVTSGPYRFTRNPMYVGLTLIYIGVAATRFEVWPLVVLPLLLAYVNYEVIPVEERRLQAVFGNGYVDYRARVRRWL